VLVTFKGRVELPALMLVFFLSYVVYIRFSQVKHPHAWLPLKVGRMTSMARSHKYWRAQLSRRRY
jgi:hypothetical protein